MTPAAAPAGDAGAQTPAPPKGPAAVLARLDAAWTRLEVALCLGSGGALLLSLTAWVLVKGLASRTTWDVFAGLVLRSLLGAVVLGLLAARVGRRRPAFVLPAVGVGLLSGLLWFNVGVDYFSNLMGWLQDGSWLTLVGGLRGLGTRLTLWLALLGGSLATAGGRQVTVDLVTRGLGEKVQKPASLAMGALAAAVCLSAAWGFVDFLSIDAFGARPEMPAAQRLSLVAHGLGTDAFVLRRQLALDLRVAPRVLAGHKWDATLTGTEWNAWLDAADWPSRVGAPAAEAMHERDPGAVRLPLASVPNRSSHGLLLGALDLVVPFGLLMIGLRFLLWCLRGGPVEAAHGEPALAGPEPRSEGAS